MDSIIISILSIVLALACLFYSIHLSVIYHRFNQSIKDWASNLDNSTNAAIYRAARDILRQVDEKITVQNENHDVEHLNYINNE